MALGVIRVTFSYKKKRLTAYFDLSINGCFDDLLKIFHTSILFVYLGINKNPQIFLKVPNQDVFIESDSSVKLFYNNL